MVRHAARAGQAGVSVPAQGGGIGPRSRSRQDDGASVATEYRTWMCLLCGWIYDEAEGWPADGIPPGTRWEDVPDTWLCPECGASKADFEMALI